MRPIHITLVILAVLAVILWTLAFVSMCHADTIAFERLTEAVIVCESGGRADAVNGECVGLMQISPIVFEEWDIEKSNFENSCAFNPPCKLCKKPLIDLYNPQDNKRVGIWYLRRLHSHYNCPSVEAIAAVYNMGPTAFKKIGYDVSKSPPRVRAYVEKVVGEYNRRAR